jgi:hypothetical protein
VAGEATRAQLAVRARGLSSVASATRLEQLRAGVRLVATRARLVPARGRLRFHRMTAGARLALRARVRLVAVVAAGVSLVHALLLPAMARVTAFFERFGAVWQAGVTARAGSVTRVHGNALHLLAMARGAGGDVRQLQLEMVRLMAAGTGDIAVPVVLGAAHARVTLGAGARRRAGERPTGARCVRMRVVAADAAPSAVGMVRVDTLVAARAGCCRRPFYVMR